MPKSAHESTHPSFPAKAPGTDQDVWAPESVLDPGIPTLFAALDPSELAKQLGLLPASRWTWGIPQEVRGEVLRRHPARTCAFELHIRAESGLRSLIGKVYAKDRQDVYRIMEAIWAAGFAREAEASIPQPIAYLPLLRLLLQEKVEGLEAKDVFVYGDDPIRVLAAVRCARWLVRFHALDLSLDRSSQVEQVLARSQHTCRFIAQAAEALAVKSERLYEALKGAASKLGATPMCPGHGDFGCYNIIFAGRRTVTFDWDSYRIADPSRDVATFIVSLERRALRNLGSIRELDAAAEAFLAAYLASAPASVRAVEHLPFYKAGICLWRAKKDLGTKLPECRQWAEAMLDEGLRTLKESAVK
jgi:aminoglycoside phosphotransferase (APT) family kinase protein